jgi:hypothetical protein
MTEEEITIKLYGEKAEHRCLVLDIGLFDVKVFDGPEDMLQDTMDKLQPMATAPLKIVSFDQLRGIRADYSGIPCGFTVIKGEFYYVPEIQY